MSLLLLVVLLRAVADIPVLWMLLFLHFSREGSGGASAAAFNVALFVTFATVHSALARDRLKRTIARLVGRHGVRPAYVTISGLTLSALLYLWRPLAGMLWRARGPAVWLSSAVFLAAVAGLLYTGSLIDYPQFLGIRPLLRSSRGQRSRGPVFSAEGPYAHCRHPMYSFLVVAFWVGPVMTFGRAEFAALGTVYLLAGAMLEERNLRQELGTVYDVYAANVPMWIPRISAWHPERPRNLRE
jgi:protein-S-isoprenylcysteine O-methyltransferase Ste14